MVKKWIDADKIAEATIIDKKLYELDIEMKAMPNFDKSEGAKKIYQRKEYVILSVKRGYVVYNIEKKFKEGHSHLKSFNMAKTLIDNCINNKIPKTRNLYLLESHIRVTNNEKYKKLIEELISTRGSKEQINYRNKRKLK